MTKWIVILGAKPDKHIPINPTETTAMSNEVRKTNAGKMSITQVDTATTLLSIQALFQKVMSGEDYNKEQVKSAVSLSNSMVKILRFEFDKYKYFHDRVTSPE